VSPVASGTSTAMATGSPLALSLPSQEDKRSMPDQQNDLRATEESIQRDADTLKRLEEEKTDLDPRDARVDRISEQVEEVAKGLRDKAVAERELSHEI